MLHRLGQSPTGLEVEARGLRRDEHPTGLTDITLNFVVHGAQVDPEAAQRALAATTDQLCPVWAMLKETTSITASVSVVQD